MAKQRPLTHQQTERLLSAYRDLSSQEKAAVSEHLATCNRCTAYATENRQIDKILKQTIRKQPDPQLAKNFYNAIEKDGHSWFLKASRLTNQFVGLSVLLIVVFSAWLVIRSMPNQTPIEAPILTIQPTASPTTAPTALPISPDTGTALQHLYTLTQTVSLFAFSPEGSYLATADSEAINLWDASTAKWLNSIPEKGESDETLTIESMAFTPNGANLLGRDNTGQFHRWLAFNGSYQRPFEGPQSPIGTPFVVGNTTLVIVTAENNLEIWPLVGSEPNVTITLSGKPIANLAVSADGQAFAAIMEDGSFILWNEYSEEMDAPPEAPETVSGLAFTNDGRQFATYQENTLQLWQENRIQHQLSSQNSADFGPIQAVRFASQNQFLMVSYMNGFLEFWDVNTGERLKTFKSESAVQTALGLTRNSFLYLTLDSQNRLTAWDKPEE